VADVGTPPGRATGADVTGDHRTPCSAFRSTAGTVPAERSTSRLTAVSINRIESPGRHHDDGGRTVTGLVGKGLVHRGQRLLDLTPAANGAQARRMSVGIQPTAG
jgi:hypothetical protein